MLAYGVFVWLETVLALLALGLAGGCVLLPFRRPERPYLWLAAPLAGAPSLGGALLLLYYGLDLPFTTALILGWFGLSGFTVACLVRGRVRLPRWQMLAAPLLVALLGSFWGTYGCNVWSIRQGEPVVAMTDGSDTFGYAINADYLRTHRASDPPRADRAIDAVAFLNLRVEGSRHVAFLLVAAGSVVSSTSGCFAYDWVSGVVMAAAVLALGGLFASRPGHLLLLFAAAVTCSWFANARCCYLGKLLGYPSCLLLGALYLETVRRPWPSRILCGCLLGPPIAFSINPLLPALVLGLLLGGLMAALVTGGTQADDGSDEVPGWHRAARACLYFLLFGCPAFLVHRLVFGGGYPPYPISWDLVIPASLDLQHPYVPTVDAGLAARLSVAFGVLNLALLGIAVARRSVAATACLLCGGLVPLAYALGQSRLFGFQGLLYPLVMVGVALLLQRRPRLLSPRLGGVVVFALGAALVALHGPQFAHAWQRALLPTHSNFPAVLARSDCEAIRHLVGDESLDTWVGDTNDSCLVLAELTCRGCDVRVGWPAHERTLNAYLTILQCPLSSPPPGEAHFALVEQNAYSPAGTVVFQGRRFKLLDARRSILVTDVRGAPSPAWDAERRPGCFLGREPVTVQIHNRTGGPAEVVFAAEVHAGPNWPAATSTLRFRLADERGAHVATPGTTLRVPLRLDEGANQLILCVEGKKGDPAVPVPHFLALTHFRFEPAKPSAGTPPEPGESSRWRSGSRGGEYASEPEAAGGTNDADQ